MTRAETRLIRSQLTRMHSGGPLQEVFAPRSSQTNRSISPMAGLRFLFALAEEQLASRTRRGFALLLRKPLRALGRCRRRIGRVGCDDGRRRRSLARCCILDLLRDVRELVEDHLKLVLVELFERADLLLEATQARG